MIPEAQKAVEELVEEYWGSGEEIASSRTPNGHKDSEAPEGQSVLSDDAVLERLFGEKEGGAKYRAAYEGNYGQYYPSPSEARRAVLCKMAFWTNGDREQMERLMRASGLAEVSTSDFDSARGSKTFIQYEIDRACNKTTERYNLERITLAGKGSRDAAPSAGEEGKLPVTDDELCDAWRDANPDYAYGLEDWHKYGGGVWPVVKEPLVKASMLDVLVEAKGRGAKAESRTLNSIHAFAKYRSYVPDEKWDANNDVIVTRNCAVEIETGKELPHSQEYYATNAVPYDFDPGAEAPNFKRFIGDLDKDIVNFLQEFAGYALTVDCSLERALWLYGPRQSGKSTYLEALIAMLGPKAGTLGLASIERSQFALAKLEGKTLVTAAEQPSLYIKRFDLLNNIISGEPIEIERKHRDSYTRRPTAKICWAANALPRVPQDAEGLFRRISVVEFEQVSDEDKDPSLKEGIKREGAGVFNWALEGLQRLRERGNFDIPDSVKAATKEFEDTSDVVARFVDECCDTDDTRYHEKASRLYQHYKWWCEDTGHMRKSLTAIAQDWKRLGFTKEEKRTRHGYFWYGVRISDYTAEEYSTRE